MKFDRWFNSHWLVADKVDTNQNFVKSSSVGFLIQAFCKHYILNCELALGHYGNNNGGGGSQPLDKIIHGCSNSTSFFLRKVVEVLVGDRYTYGLGFLSSNLPGLSV